MFDKAPISASGMLLMGFTLRNIPVITDGVYINFRWSAALRNIALAVILARAGLGLDPSVCCLLELLSGRCFFVTDLMMGLVLSGPEEAEVGVFAGVHGTLYNRGLHHRFGLPLPHGPALGVGLHPWVNTTLVTDTQS